MPKSDYGKRFGGNSGEFSIFTPSGTEAGGGVVRIYFGGGGTFSSRDSTIKIFTNDTPPEILLAIAQSFQHQALVNLEAERVREAEAERLADLEGEE